MIDSINGLSNWLSQLNPDAIGRKQQPNMFDKIDKNGDGVIDEEEMQAFLTELETKSGNAIDAEKLFTTVDTNEDGLIDEEEFNAGKDKAREIIGTMPPPMGIGKNGEDFSNILMDMLNTEKTDEQMLMTKAQYGTLANLYLGNYMNNGDANQDNPFDILA